MSSRLMSIQDETSVQRGVAERTEDTPGDGLYCNIKSRLRSRLPGGFNVGDILCARIRPSLQGVVLGKVWGREALRVITAPYSSASTPIPAAAIDLPAALIPDQSKEPNFKFDNSKVVSNYVHFFGARGAIRHEQEALLLQWINKKGPVDVSTYTAYSEWTKDLHADEPLAGVQPVDSDCSDHSEPLSMSGPSCPSAPLVEIGEQPNKSCNSVSVLSSSSVSGSAIRVEPIMPSSDSNKMDEFKQEVTKQLGELRDLMGSMLKRQKDCEEKLSQVATQVSSSSTSQWEHLEERVQAMTSELPKRDARDEESDWPLRDNTGDEVEWQVKTVTKRLGDVQEEKIECPFTVQPRRLDGFRVPRAHRRAHRRFLEDIYGSHDSAAAAARAMLEQLEKETRAPSWEVAGLLNAAKGLDILLLEHPDGMWSQWNQAMVDYLARYFFEMLARIRPEEDIVQLMNPELQKKVKEFNFGKQRAYGPLSMPGRPPTQRPWRGFQNYNATIPSFSSGNRKDGKKGFHSPEDGQEQQPLQNDVGLTQGNWVWQAQAPVGRPPPPFRNDPAPAYPGLAGPRPPQ